MACVGLWHVYECICKIGNEFVVIFHHCDTAAGIKTQGVKMPQPTKNHRLKNGTEDA